MTWSSSPPTESVRLLGQVVDVVEPTGDDALTGFGVVIGTLDEAGAVQRGDRPPFRGAAMGLAGPTELGGLHGAAAGTLTIGTWRTGDVGAEASLRAGGFNRHTFLCGQSGSGKTYALGVLLERLLLQTDLRMAVFDPNADFVHLGSTLPGVAEADARRIADRGVRVLRSNSTRTEGDEPLRMRFRTMTRQAQAATLQLDPVRDQDEYNAFISFLTQIGPHDGDGRHARGVCARAPPASSPWPGGWRTSGCSTGRCGRATCRPPPTSSPVATASR